MKYILISVFIFSFLIGNSQQKLFFVDTIQMNSPIVLSLPANKNDSLVKIPFIIEREKIKYIFDLNLKYFDDIIKLEGYVFICPIDYSLIGTTLKYGNLSKSDSLLYSCILNDLRNKSKNIIYKKIDRNNPKYLFGFEYYDIYPTKFYSFIIIGDYIQKTIDIFETPFKKYKRLYLPVLIPYE